MSDPITEPDSVRPLARKRRAIRKGTKSCWECKRRKIRCTFLAPAGPVCDGCKSRQVNCIGQDVDSPVLRKVTSDQNDRSIERAAKQCGITAVSTPGAPQHTGQALGFLDDVSRASNPLSFSAARDPQPTLDRGLQGHFTPICRSLVAVWPCQEELDVIASTHVGAPLLFHGIVCKPYAEVLSTNSVTVHKILQTPSAESHPVKIARKLLLLASYLQSGPSGVGGNSIEPKKVFTKIMARIVETVSQLVTNNDDLVDSIEGIECIMMESMYLNNAGLLRQAWLKNRRAMLLAQLMGLHTQPSLPPNMLDVETRKRIDPDYMWCRLVCSDRYLSLMVGLPQGSQDSPFATPEALRSCAPIDRMERLHAVVGGRIIQRGREDLYEGEATNELDKMLRDAAALMAPQWWLSPDATSFGSSGPDGASQMIRLMMQMTHFHLVAQLHLPYLLPHSIDSTYDYSKLTAVSASREILSRFLLMRGSSMIATYCRGVDFLVLHASAILCLAHIEASRHVSNRTECILKVLGHQRLGDRGLLERTLEVLMEAAEGDDAVARRISSLLNEILAAEAAATNGETYHATLTSESSDQIFKNGDHTQAHSPTLRVNVPCLGTITIEHARGIYTWDAAGMGVSSWEPALTTEMEDASLQGADTALFDSLFLGLMAPTDGEMLGNVVPRTGSDT